MQVSVTSLNKVHSKTKNVLTFILITFYCFICMSFTVNNNDGSTKNDGNAKSEKKEITIGPASSIGPSEETVIRPQEDNNTITPMEDDKAEKKNTVQSIGYEFLPAKKEEVTIQPEPKITTTIQPSIGPSTKEIRPSNPTPSAIVVRSQAQEVKSLEPVKGQNNLQLISTSYMAKQRNVKKDNVPIAEPASILDMINHKTDKAKTTGMQSLIDNIASSSTAHTSINWMTWDEAMRKNAQSPRKVMVELYTDWCTWCVKMDKSTFQDPAIIQYINENFYAVKFNAETREEVFFKGQKFGYIQDGNKGYNLFSLYLTRGKLTYPSIVFLDETVNNPQPIKGFQNIGMMNRLLQYFGENYYKEMDWSLYNQSFESASR
ncbi:MAG: DUF255 domain-containing protein [Chitinophagales bacterium]